MARRHWRHLSVVGAAVVAAVIAGCGGSGDSDKASTGGNRPAADTGPVTLKWESWSPLDPEAKQLIAEFNKTNPNIKVEYKFLQYPDYIKDLKLKMASGEGPDIFFGQSGAMIREYAEFAEDLGPYAQKLWGGGWKNRFYPVGLNQTILDGKAAGIPFGLLTAGWVWYNADLLKKAGIQEPPKTLEELIADAKKLRGAGVTPFVQGAKDNWINFDTYMAIANQTAPGVVYQADAGKAKWTDPGLVQAMQIWKRLFTDGVMEKGALSKTQYPDAAQAFYKGQAAMTMEGSWEVGNLVSSAGRAILKGSYGVKKYPEWRPFAFPDVNGDGQPGTLTSGPDAIAMINSASKHKDAAWKFVAFLVGQGGQQFHADHLLPPAAKGYKLDPSKAARPDLQDVLEAQISGLDSAKYPREFNYPEIQEALGQALQKVASGQQDPEAAMASVQQASDRIRR
jgi:raffinose/stachyose/melibiose transport system substrate-binding protein